MSSVLAALRLCLVTDPGLAAGRDLADIVAAAVRGGVTMVQLRDKTASTRCLVDEAGRLLALLRPLGVPLIVNDRLDVALAVDADGVHVGQDDMPLDRVRALIGPAKIVGLSITRLEDLRDVHCGRADYLGVGPIFAQTTKPDATPPLRLDGLAAVRRATTAPIVAIGGIGPDNARAVFDTGADGVAVVSALMASADPEAAARTLVRRAPRSLFDSIPSPS